MFLVNSCQGNFHCGRYCYRQALSRSYGRLFAEFLEDLSLVRLGLLDLTTCVGLRYGRSCIKGNEAFLDSISAAGSHRISPPLPLTLNYSVRGGFACPGIASDE